MSIDTYLLTQVSIVDNSCMQLRIIHNHNLFIFIHKINLNMPGN